MSQVVWRLTGKTVSQTQKARHWGITRLCSVPRTIRSGPRPPPPLPISGIVGILLRSRLKVREWELQTSKSFIYNLLTGPHPRHWTFPTVLTSITLHQSKTPIHKSHLVVPNGYLVYQTVRVWLRFPDGYTDWGGPKDLGGDGTSRRWWSAFRKDDDRPPVSVVLMGQEGLLNPRTNS